MHNTETRWVCDRCGRIEVAGLDGPEGWRQMGMPTLPGHDSGRQVDICDRCHHHFLGWWEWGQSQRHVEQGDMCTYAPDSRHFTTEVTGDPSGTTSRD